VDDAVQYVHVLLHNMETEESCLLEVCIFLPLKSNVFISSFFDVLPFHTIAFVLPIIFAKITSIQHINIQAHRLEPGVLCDAAVTFL